MATTSAGQLLGKIKNLGSSDATEITKEKVRTSGMAGIIGGGMGFVYAYYNRKPFLIYVSVGAILAAIGARLILNKVDSDAFKK